MSDASHNPFPGGRSLSGSVVAGYRIGQQISSSDMGEVYLATQLSMNRKVAFKVLSDALTHDHETVQTFLNEIRLLAQMEHPHIVTAIDAGNEGGLYYLVMTFVGGEDLARRIERRGPMSSRKAIETMQQVAKGMAYAWKSHQILHRDIKPSNIMITRDGMAKVLDMGVSVQSYIDAGGVPGQDLVGTPHYLSPERIQGTGEATVRSEIYALGATYYHAVTGRPPYHEVPVEQILSGRDMPELTPAAKANPRVDPLVSDLIEQMMMRHPNLRPGSWEELLKQIGDVHEHLVQTEAVRRDRRDTRLDFKTEAERAVDHKSATERQEQDNLATTSRIRRAAKKREIRRGLHPMTIPSVVVAAICLVGTCVLYFAGKAARDDARVGETPGSPVRRESLIGMSHHLTDEGTRWENVTETAPRPRPRLQAVRPGAPDGDANDPDDDRGPQ